MNSVRCPKCGRDSESEDVCDFCGAMISRIRDRERELALEQEYGGAASALAYDSGAGTSGAGKLTKLVLAVAVVGMAAAFFGRDILFKPKMPEGAFIRDYDGGSFDTMVAKGPPETTYVVDFWAPWCGPCRQFAPEFEATAASVAPKALFVKVNVDDAKRVAEEYGVQGIPTVMVMRGGRVIDRAHGMDRESLKAWVEGHL